MSSIVESTNYYFPNSSANGRGDLGRLLNSSIVGVVFWHIGGRLLEANDLFLATIGYTREELREGQLNWKRLTPPEHIHTDEQALWQLLATGSCTPFEKEYIHKQGHRVSVLIGSTLCEEQRDKAISFVMDISDQKRAEAALRASEERYRELFENAKDAVYVHDLEGRYISVNRAAERLTGFSRAEIIGRHFSEFIEPSDIERISKSLTGKLAARKGTTYEVNVVARDGRLIPVEVSSRLIYENGVPIGVQGLVRDITERKRSELAIREAERRYRDIFENAGEGIFQSTPDGKYLATNPELARIYGFESPEELIRSCNDISHQVYVDPSKRDEFKRLIEAHGIVRGFEHQVFRKDGSRIWITVNARAVRDDAGAVLYYEGTVQDITERKLSEQRLREYEKVVESLDEMIVVVDRDYRYLLANRRFLSYRNKTHQELLGHHIAEVVGHQAFEDVVKKEVDECLQGRVVKYELTVQHPNLGQRDLFISYFPIEGPNGIECAAGVLQDITDHKRAAEALRQSEERFTKAFHSSPAAFGVALRNDGTLLEVNDAFLRMTGYLRHEVLGKSVFDIGLCPEINDRKALVEQVLRRSNLTDVEIVFCTKSGEERNGLLSVDFIELDGKQCVLGIAQDVTERKHAESALRNYSRLLTDTQEAERQRIARELHDQIGQMLTAIRLNLQTIRKPGSSANVDSVIHETTAMVDQAMEQVRDLSFDLRPSLLDDLGLTSALRWYADRYATRAGIRVTTTIKLPESQHLSREVETACFRIVQEALTNIARHAQAKRVSIRLIGLKGGLSLSVKDDGIGLDKGFITGSSSTHSLGLCGMRERALTLGGKLEIASDHLKGTEIRVFLPNATRGHKGSS